MVDLQLLLRGHLADLDKFRKAINLVEGGTLANESELLLAVLSLSLGPFVDLPSLSNEIGGKYSQLKVLSVRCLNPARSRIYDKRNHPGLIG